MLYIMAVCRDSNDVRFIVKLPVTFPPAFIDDILASPFESIDIIEFLVALINI